MKKFNSLLIIGSLSLLVSCVPARQLEELQLKYDDLTSMHKSLQNEKDYCDTTNKELKAEINEKEAEFLLYQEEAEKQALECRKLNESFEVLNRNYEKLVKSNEITKSDLRYELDRLDKQLAEKKEELAKKEVSLIKQETATLKLQRDLEKLEKSLADREKKVNELQAKLKAQEDALTNLKDKLTESLIGYKNSGISVVQKDGKVYVSLDNSLLFQSGKTDIDWKGKTALLKVAESLKDLNDFDIVVEGHTDNVPMKSAAIKDNWDLSVLRATSVVRYMTTEGGMDPLKIIPSGRSKYVPVNDADSKEARAENRRIEIILTPKLDHLMDLLGTK